MKRRLYIDFDGVVMDTIPFLYSALEKSEVDLSNEEKCLFSSQLMILIKLLMMKIY